MFRCSLLAVVVLLSGCGIEPAVPGVESPLVEQPPAAPLPTSALEVRELAPKTDLLSRISAPAQVVNVHSLAAADGTRVRYLLGVLGCGISVFAKGTATVQGGAFTIQYDTTPFDGQASLFFQVDTEGTGVCEPGTTPVFEVPAELPGSVDLSVMPQQSYAGCWLFD